MRVGKAAPAVLERSVFRPLYLEGAGGQKDAFGTDGCIFETAPGAGAWAVSTQTGAIGEPRALSVRMLLERVRNDLAVCGAPMRMLQTGLVWPAQGDERALQETMRQLASYCRELGITVSGGDTTVAGELGRPVLTLTGMGPVLSAAEKTPVTEGMGLVMAGSAGEAGMLMLASALERELRGVFPGSLVDLALKAECSVTSMAEIAFRMQAAAMHDVSRGGVFGAIWEFSRRLGCGFDVQLKKLPIRQECIEICEYLDLNPYQLFGQGALLIVTGRPEELCGAFAERGIAASLIGSVNRERGSRILSGEEIRYLEKPAQDMLDMYMEKQRKESANDRI